MALSENTRKELDALAVVAETLGKLDPDAAHRILRWAVARFVDDVDDALL